MLRIEFALDVVSPKTRCRSLSAPVHSASQRCVFPSQRSPVSFDCLIGICRIIGVVGKAAWFGYGLLPALFDRFPFILVRIFVRVTRTLFGARHNEGFGHDPLLKSLMFSS